MKTWGQPPQRLLAILPKNGIVRTCGAGFFFASKNGFRGRKTGSAVLEHMREEIESRPRLYVHAATSYESQFPLRHFP